MTESRARSSHLNGVEKNQISTPLPERSPLPAPANVQQWQAKDRSKSINKVSVTRLETSSQQAQAKRREVVAGCRLARPGSSSASAVAGDGRSGASRATRWQGHEATAGIAGRRGIAHSIRAFGESGCSALRDYGVGS